MNILVDTNVIIDALTGREPFREAAEQIFIIAANQTESMYVTASSATDIYYLVRKYLHSIEKAKKVMEKLYELFGILDITADECREALSSEIKDYEDAVISCCASHNKIDYVLTRNVKDFEHSKIRVLLPEDFLEMIRKDEE